MNSKKLPPDFPIVPEMFSDGYFPNFLVDKVKSAILDAVAEIENGGKSVDEIQQSFDKMTIRINELQEEFEENDSEIETGARESIGETIIRILEYFEIDFDVEEAIRERDW